MSQNPSALEELKNIYSDVSEWLKFAEAKHAATFAVWTALLIAELSFDLFWNSKIIYQILFTFPIFIGMLINLAAFIPFMNRWEFLRKLCWKKYQNFPADNVVFYITIFTSSYRHTKPKEALSVQVDRYRQILEGKLGDIRENSLEIDYVRQIVEVSAVATIKVYLFALQTGYILLLLFIICLAMIIA